MEFMDTFIGRQPILDGEGKCVGYELLYRNAIDSIEATFANDRKATARVVINIVHNIGLSAIIGDKTGFINVDENIILSDLIYSLPKEKFVFEILEYTQVSPLVINKIQYLHKLGYRFALDDFSCNNENIEYFRNLFPYIDIIKVDLLASDSDEIDTMITKFKELGIKLLAEKVENVEAFKRCQKAGFDYFQGYFFEKPSIIAGKKIEPSVTNAVELINALHVTDDIHSISEKFTLCPELTYNLLRYVNSAEFNFKHEITSVKQILQLLGPSRLRSWLGLFLYADSENRLFGEAIIDAAKFRANLMSKLVSAHGRPELADEAFLAGSLSLIDTFLQVSMEEIIEKIQLSGSTIDALLKREGYLGKFLSIVEKLETTEKIQTLIDNLAPKINLAPSLLYEMYTDSLGFSERRD
ncbi:MAG: signal peptide protein [Sulfuricurvum sp. MLSB]|nr:MAG: signal peptide protein [Sulfuricurvum sp. MLSB]